MICFMVSNVFSYLQAPSLDSIVIVLISGKLLSSFTREPKLTESHDELLACLFLRLPGNGLSTHTISFKHQPSRVGYMQLQWDFSVFQKIFLKNNIKHLLFISQIF